MDYKEILESGKLELYALGALDPQEEKEISALLASNPELKKEYESIADALTSYGKAESSEAPAHVLDKVKAEISKSEDSLIPLRPNNATTRFKRLSIAASVLLLVSLGLNIRLNTALKQSQENYISLSRENQQLASNTVKFADENAKMQSLIASISKSSMNKTFLGSTEQYQGYESAVYWDTTNSEVVLATNNLPGLSENEQYQLWAIVDGKPVDAGVFTSSDQLIKMKNINGNAVAFAVTIEPKGGSIEPTLEKMCMIGNVNT